MELSSGRDLTININEDGIGISLKRMRELRELSMEEVAHRLRLQCSVVELMESGAFPGNLPEIFAKGYIKSYARLLQFSEQDIVSMLELLKFHSPLYNTSYFSTSENPVSSYPFTYLLTGLVVLIMIALVAMWVEPNLLNIISKWFGI